MKDLKPLINQKFKLEKYPGKGGWTFARIPKVLTDKKKAFRWVRVKGTIDEYRIQKYHLMPMKTGQLFLPVKADIRKKIQKKEGDWVHVILYPDNDALKIPRDMQICLDDEPSAKRFFNSLSETEKKYYVQWIYAGKKIDTRVNRLAKAINKLSRGLKMYEREEEA